MAENKGWRLFCPLMKELCVNGHTKSMGVDADEVPINCAFWQERMVIVPETKQIEPARACYFHHATAISLNQIQATNQGTASTDEVRKELAFIRGLSTGQLLEAEKAPAELPDGSDHGRPRLS